jgi:stage II sporulation protein D
MKSFFAFAILFALNVPTSLALLRNRTALVANPTLRILLARRQNTLRVSALSGRLLFITPEGVQRDLGREARLAPDRKPGWILVNGVATPAPFFLKGSDDTDRMRLQAGTYAGWIQVQRETETLTAINYIDLENYLVGTVASEMHPTWELEALKAQAVAARSYALYMHQHPRHHLFDMEADISDQVYNGAAEPPPKVVRAVIATRGEFLSENGNPLRAHFHSRCGGQTDAAGAVWQDGTATETGVACPYCQKHPFAWKTMVRLSELLAKLNLSGAISDSLRLVPLSRAPSGRIHSLELILGGNHRKLSGNDLRDKVGFTKLKSTWFTWKVSGDVVQFDGVGAGHGVGMCQWGAKELAHQGRDHLQILKYFYPKVAISKWHR